MRVFLSWSGDLSREYAAILHDWLPMVIQKVKPYMSAETIQIGERWVQRVASELAETNHGLVCLTPYNLGAPWIMFEAGALSKSLEAARLTPLLFDVEPEALARSPLGQFQATRFCEDGMLKLLRSIAAEGEEHERISADVLARAFKSYWPELERRVAGIRNDVQSHEPFINKSRLPNHIQKSIISNALDALVLLSKISLPDRSRMVRRRGEVYHEA